MVPSATKLDPHPLAGAGMVRGELRDGRRKCNYGGCKYTAEGQGGEGWHRKVGSCPGVGWVQGVREELCQVAALCFEVRLSGSNPSSARGLGKLLKL